MTMTRAGRFLVAAALAAAVAPMSRPSAQSPLAPQSTQVTRAAQAPAAGERWETAFRALPEAARIRAYNERMSARPHHVGSPYDKDNTEWMLARFKEWGWDATIERFDVLFPTPKIRLPEMTAPTRLVVKLDEPTEHVQRENRLSPTP